MQLPQVARDKIESNLLKLAGWCSIKKGIRMAEYIAQDEVRFALEIGVFGGRSLACMGIGVQYVPNGLAIGIDPWTTEAALEGSNDKANDDWWSGKSSKLDLDSEHTKAFKAMGDLGLHNHVVIIRSTSAMCRKFLGAPIGMLHVDGNHSEETSTIDVKMWLPLVEAGGIVVFDDTNWTSTNKALAMVQAECEQLDLIDNCAFFRKRA